MAIIGLGSLHLVLHGQVIFKEKDGYCKMAIFIRVVEREKRSSGVSDQSDTNWAVQSQKKS